MKERTVRAGEEELFKSRAREKGRVKIIDLLRARLDARADEYKAELRRIIDAKVAGEEVVEPKSEQPANVVDLMDALRKSLDAVSESKKKQAKAKKVRTPRATARKRKRA